jgi:O-Antigen ligase
MIALILVLFSLVVLPQTKLEIESAPFLALSALTGVFAANTRIRQTTSKAGLCIIFFFCMCMTHVGFVFAETVTTAEYVRGLAPFLFLGFYFVTTRLASVKNIHLLYLGIIGSALIFSMENLILLPQVLSGEIWRSTYVNGNHNIPMPLAGFHFCVALAIGKSTKVRHKAILLFLAALMLLSSFLTGTRSLIIASLLPLFILPLIEAPSLKRWTRYSLALALLCVTFVFVPIEPLLRGARIGGSQVGSIDTRVQENDIAFNLIERAPIIGNGLGFRFDTNGLYYAANRVGYVHNSLLYLLMDFGIFGLLYLAAPLYAVRALKQVREGPHRDYATGLVLTLMALVLDSLGFAIVRLIHFNVIFAIVIGMLEVLKRDYAALGFRVPAYRYIQLQLRTPVRG